MRALADHIMSRRACRLATRISPHLPSLGTVADIGSGTGHNAETIRRSTPLIVQEFDIADLHWVGPGPVIFREGTLPTADKSFDATLMVFVLQYPQSPVELLAEVRRISRGRVIVLQSTYRGWIGRFVLAIRECLWGRLAFHVAVLFRVFTATQCPLQPRRYFTRAEIEELFKSAGFNVLSMQQREWSGLGVSRDLFVLESMQPAQE